MINETEIDIDALLRDTFLTVVELRRGTPVRRGAALYQHCQQQIEQVREQLQKAGFNHQDIGHITYAQCALLDETVLNRADADEGQIVWLETPLQALFFNTHQAGELLYERIKQVLQEPAPAQAVVTCFHRVLLLGFRGRYQDPHSPEREQLINELDARARPFTFPQDAALLNIALSQGGYRLHHWPVFWLVLSAVVLAGVWFGLDSWLSAQVDALLPPNLR